VKDLESFIELSPFKSTKCRTLNYHFRFFNTPVARSLVALQAACSILLARQELLRGKNLSKAAKLFLLLG
jgi:hypothetical protein